MTNGVIPTLVLTRTASDGSSVRTTFSAMTGVADHIAYIMATHCAGDVRYTLTAAPGVPRSGVTYLELIGRTRLRVSARGSNAVYRGDFKRRIRALASVLLVGGERTAWLKRWSDDRQILVN